jgi:hypothetical protein
MLEIQGLIINAIKIEKIKAIIANFGIGHIYSHIIHVTANIQTNERIFVIVESTTHALTSLTALRIACVFDTCVMERSSKCL